MKEMIVYFDEIAECGEDWWSRVLLLHYSWLPQFSSSVDKSELLLCEELCAKSA